MGLARECAVCGCLIGCHYGKNKTQNCDVCLDWDACWLDLCRYRDVPKSHGYCLACVVVLWKKIERRRENKINLGRRKDDQEDPQKEDQKATQQMQEGIERPSLAICSCDEQAAAEERARRYDY